MNEVSRFNMFIEKLSSIVVEIATKEDLDFNEWGELPKSKRFWQWTEDEKELYEWKEENERYQSNEEHERENNVLREIYFWEVMRQRCSAC